MSADASAPSGGAVVADGQVKVVCRVRPLSAGERADKHTEVLVAGKDGTSVYFTDEADQSRPFARYDAVFGADSEQQAVFEMCAKEVVDLCLQGFNGTVFAYGQTGSGKTFTMEGTAELPGVIPRAFEALWQGIAAEQARSPSQAFAVRVSYLEVYNEKIRDLLSQSSAALKIRESKANLFFVEDLTTVDVTGPAAMTAMMEQGKANRVTGATNMNEQSSRSHAIFTVHVERQQTDGSIVTGKLNLVDLAGSERQSKTGAQGQQLQEAKHINLSLSQLGNVISALTDKRHPFVPYRNSALTKLLSDSLGGNARTVMIAACGPAEFNYDETQSTLRFASRVKLVKNTPTVNENEKDAQLREYREEVARLKARLQGHETPEKASVRRQQVAALEATIDDLRAQLAEAEQESAQLRAALETAAEQPPPPAPPSEGAAGAPAASSVQVDELKAQLRQAKSDAVAEKRQHAKAFRALKSEHGANTRALDAARAELGEWESKLAEALAQQEAHGQRHDAIVNELELRHHYEMMSAAEELDHAARERDQLFAALDVEKAARRRQKNNHDNLAAESLELKRTVKSLQTTAAKLQALQGQQAEHEAALQSQASEHAEALAQLEASHTAKAGDAGAERAALQAELQALRGQHAEDVAQHEAALQSQASEHAEALAQLEASHTAKAGDAGAERAALQAELQALRGQHAEAVAQHEAALQSQASTHAEALAQLEASHTAKAGDAGAERAALQAELQALQGQHAEAVAQHEAALQSQASEHAEALAQLEASHTAKAGDAGAERAALQAELQALRGQHAEAVAQHEAALQSQASTHAEALAQLEASHTAKAGDAGAERAALQAELQALQGQHAEAVAQHEAALQSQASEHAEALAQLEASHTAKAGDAGAERAALQAELQALQGQHAEAVAQHATELATLRSSHEAQTEELEALRQEQGRLQAKLRAAKPKGPGAQQADDLMAASLGALGGGGDRPQAGPTEREIELTRELDAAGARQAELQAQFRSLEQQYGHLLSNQQHQQSSAADADGRLASLELKHAQAVAKLQAEHSAALAAAQMKSAEMADKLLQRQEQRGGSPRGRGPPGNAAGPARADGTQSPMHDGGSGGRAQEALAMQAQFDFDLQQNTELHLEVIGSLRLTIEEREKAHREELEFYQRNNTEIMLRLEESNREHLDEQKTFYQAQLDALGGQVEKTQQEHAMAMLQVMELRRQLGLDAAGA